MAATASVCLFAVATCAGSLAAKLGLDDQADHLFAQALELTTNFGAPYLVASAQLEWGRALLDRTAASPERARQLLTEALDSAKRFGYAEIERVALELLDIRNAAG